MPERFDDPNVSSPLTFAEKRKLVSTRRAARNIFRGFTDPDDDGAYGASSFSCPSPDPMDRGD